MYKKALIVIILVFGIFPVSSVYAFQTVAFPSEDSLLITADVYLEHPPTAPFILLFHQAGFSRGEYREIAPRLNEMGFNVMAIDQRSGEAANGVKNETAARAKAQGKPTTYLDALQDMKDAIRYAKTNYVKDKFIIWGSSYSAALVLKIAGDTPHVADGVLAFAPGEYFSRFGKSKAFITQSAQHISVPVFITSAKSEKRRWFSIFQKIPSRDKQFFLPETEGIHGSRALWKSTPEHAEYWKAVEKFLQQFISGGKTDGK